MPISAVATAPLPIPQLSIIETNGASVYPDPGAIISIPRISPVALTIAFPFAPDPPPPQKLIVGGPQESAPNPQPSNTLSRAEFTSKLKSKIPDSGSSIIFVKLSTTAFALLKILVKFRLPN